MKRTISFLAVFIVATAAIAGPAQSTPEVRRGKLRRGPMDFGSGHPVGMVVNADGIRLKAGAAGRGLFTSPVISTEFQASALSFLWKANLPEGSELLVEVRYKSKGGKWTEWLGLEGYPTDEYPETKPELAGYFFDPDPHLVLDGVDFLQFRLQLVGGAGKPPLFKEMLINYADLRPLLMKFEKRRKGRGK